MVHAQDLNATYLNETDLIMMDDMFGNTTDLECICADDMIVCSDLTDEEFCVCEDGDIVCEEPVVIEMVEEEEEEEVVEIATPATEMISEDPPAGAPDMDTPWTDPIEDISASAMLFPEAWMSIAAGIVAIALN